MQIALVVQDIETSKRKWSALLGLEPFQEFTVPGWPEAPTYTDGAVADCSDVKAVKFLLDDNMMLALFEPGESPSPWKKHLEEHGESVMFLELQPNDQSEALNAIREVCGIEEPTHIEYQKGVAYAIMPTGNSLGIDLNLILSQNDPQLIEKINNDPDLYRKLPREDQRNDRFDLHTKISVFLQNGEAKDILKRYLPDLFSSGRISLAGMLDLETVLGFCDPPVSEEMLDRLKKELIAIHG